MNEFDQTLSRLFAEARETPPADDFTERVIIRMTQARRRRAVKQAVLTTAAAGLAIALTPYLVEGSLAGASHLGDWLPALGGALASPAGWACSLAVAGWSLLRSRRLS
jgi:hypothetical protein